LALSPQNIGLTGASDPEIAPELKRSLFFSLLAGNLGVETGSTTTASATTHSLDRPQRFPGLTRNARIWRGQRRRGCLCKQASGAAAVRSTRILWPRIPVSRKQRPSVAETGSTWMSDQSFIRYRRRNPSEEQGSGPHRARVRCSTDLAGWPDRADDRYRAGESRIGLQNVAYKIRRLVTLERMAAAKENSAPGVSPERRFAHKAKQVCGKSTANMSIAPLKRSIRRKNRHYSRRP
jgi:hypothetical protein